MANDREVLSQIWNGQIPICFKLDPKETVALQTPDSFYLMVSRLSYFPLVTDKIRKHLIKYIPNDKQDEELWLESNGAPVKWHFPIGLLFDLYCATADRSEGSNIPWHLTVHFGNFPEKVIFRCPNKEIVEAHFMSCLKEADVLKHRGAIVSNMLKKDHTQLWLGLLNNKFDQFWAVNRRLMETVPDQEGFKHIPLRCYSEDGTYLQRLITPFTSEGVKKSVHDFLNEISQSYGRKAVGITTHGVSIPNSTPLQWLSEHMSYPDNFLHLCMIFDE
uniref:Autophagy protein 5 n=1 Tax=Xenopsylla cheopis TaxID=163159 RepID=A0A6M2DFH1_XENCH